MTRASLREKRLFLALLFLGVTFATLACGQGKRLGGSDAASGGAPGATGGGGAASSGAPATTGGAGGSSGTPTGGWAGSTGGVAGCPIGSGAGGRVAGSAPARHRPEAVTCEMNPAPTAATCTPLGAASIAASNCSTDAECTAGGNGRCVHYSVRALEVRCRCTYTECHRDEDCSSAGPCRCGGTDRDAWGNACLEGNCRVDADCGPGGFCSPTRRRSALFAEAERPTAVAGYYCHTAGDECIDDCDCAQAYGPTQCAYDEAQRRWTCALYH